MCVPRAFPACRAHPAVPRRYLLCELVSEDPRCRLSLDDRVLGGLVRDTIARVHGAFGAAACSVGFAGARAPQVGCGARFAGEGPGHVPRFVRERRVLEKQECGESRTEQKMPVTRWDEAKSSIPSPGVCQRELLPDLVGGGGVEFNRLSEGSHVEFLRGILTGYVTTF